MTFAGWALVDVATLFGVGALAITGLYLLRMRRRQVVVPFAALWDSVTRESDTRRLWKKLRRMLSWLLQLALLALLCVSLGDPRPDVWLRDPVTLAIVIDRSASMAGPAEGEAEAIADAEATEDEDAPPRSRLDAAIERARAEINGLGPADRAVIIAAGAEIRVPGPLSGDPATLLRSLDDLRTQPGEANLEHALALALNAVRDQEGARVLVLTDGAVDVPGASAVARCSEGDVPCQVALFRGPNANLALTAFAARRYPNDREHVEVLAEVQNLGDEGARAILEVEADGISVGGRPLELAAGETRREVLPNLDAARTRLQARLVPFEGDGAAADAKDLTRGGLGPDTDDRAHAIVPPMRPLKVALVNDGSNLFLEAALLTLEDHIELRGLSPEDAATDRGRASLEEVDLAIFDIAGAPLPDPLPSGNLVIFDPHRLEGSPSPIAKDADIPRPFLTEQLKDHPLLEHVVLKDVNIARGTSLRLEQGDTALVRSLGEPMVVLRSGPRLVLAFGFDPRQSDFPLRVAFPVLVHNTIAFFERAMPGFVASVPVGPRRPLAVTEIGLSPDGLTEVAVSGPEPDAEAEGDDETILATATAPVQRGVFRMRAMDPGIYRVRAIDGPNPGAEALVAVNQASAMASDLHDRLSSLNLPEDTGAPEPPEPAPVGDGPLWTLLLLAAAALVALEWATYHRRVTV